MATSQDLPPVPPLQSANDLSSPIWQAWFHKLREKAASIGAILWTQLTLPTEVASQFLASPQNVSGQVAFRGIVAADVGGILQPSQGGTGVNILGLPGQVLAIDVSGTGFTYEDGANMAYAVQIIQASSTVMYKGEAQPGSLTSAAVWRIQQITLNTPAAGDIQILWAGGSSAFTEIWDNYATLTYS